MGAIVSLLVVLVLSLIIVRVATVALVLTGLSQQLARFQARSAFTGAGFTTDESEKVVQHPVRRRIIMLLMLLGNAGIVTAMSTLVVSFGGAESPTSISLRLLALAIGLVALWFFARSQWVDQRMSQLIGWSLKRFTTLELRDYAGLLHLTGDYVVAQLNIEPSDWLCDKPLKQLRLSDEGVLVLGIERPDGTYIGAPRGDVELHAADSLLLYGRQEVIANLDFRRGGAEGNWEHFKSIEKQAHVEKEEREAVASDEAAEQQSPTP